MGIIVKVGDIFGGHMSAMVFSKADVPGEDGEEGGGECRTPVSSPMR